MAELSKVETLYSENCRDIPAMLRQSADNIETEGPEGFARTTAMIAVQLTENGVVQVYGWGDTDTLRAIGLLHCGLNTVVDMQIGPCD